MGIFGFCPGLCALLIEIRRTRQDSGVKTQDTQLKTKHSKLRTASGPPPGKNLLAFPKNLLIIYPKATGRRKKSERYLFVTFSSSLFWVFRMGKLCSEDATVMVFGPMRNTRHLVWLSGLIWASMATQLFSECGIAKATKSRRLFEDCSRRNKPMGGSVPVS
jgi:hypothetical protein